MFFTLPFIGIDPVALQLGPIAIHWYGISYVVGIILGYYYAKWLIKRNKLPISAAMFDDLLTYIIIGIIAGGRLGYVLFYDPLSYLANPLDIFKTYMGGMSFHGGITGVIISIVVFCRKYHQDFVAFCDLISIVTPIGLMLGRIANFINGELYGRPTDMPWGIIFPGEHIARHPSQLYEAFSEGMILLILMYFISSKIHIRTYCTAVFLIGYSIARISCECFREPDAHIGYIYEVTMGQILSLPMLIFGLGLLLRIYKQKQNYSKL